MKIIATKPAAGWYISDQHGAEFVENAVYETLDEAMAYARSLGPVARRDVIVGSFADSGDVRRVHAGIFE